METFGYLTRFLRLAGSSGLLYSGLGARLRREQLKGGDLPYRVLRYERIAAPEDLELPVLKTSFVRPEAFEQQMRMLVRHFHVLPLREFVEALYHRRPISEKAVVVTIDGGWKETYTNAFPILAQYAVPATVFLPTSFIGTGNLPWTYKVIIAVLLLSQDKVELPDFPFLENEYAALKQSLPTNLASPAKGLALADMLQLHPSAVRRAVLEELSDLLANHGGIPEFDAFMSWEEVEEMSQAPGITFGSLGHLGLPFDEYIDDELRAELTVSFNTFIQHNVEPFPAVAFPNGLLTKSAHDAFEQVGVAVAFGEGRLPDPRKLKAPCPILGRIKVYQDNSYHPAVLASLLWDLNFRFLLRMKQKKWSNKKS